MNSKAVLSFFASFVSVVGLSATNACIPACDHPVDTTEHFTPEKDDEAVTQLQMHWTGTLKDGRSVDFDLCEDVANDVEPEVDCGLPVHLVRSGGRGEDESYTEKATCTRPCYRQAAMNAVGNLVVGGKSVAVDGFVEAQSDGIYAEDAREARLHASNEGTAIQIDYGDTSDDGTFGWVSLTKEDSSNGTKVDESVILRSTGPATCPLPIR
ncbi:MAG TPA: hypothetical protein VF407_21200 [Polyangiaceae bacterium]